MKATIKLLTLILALLLPTTGTAEEVYDFEVDGIYYKIVNDNAIVTYKTYSYVSHDSYYYSDYKGDVTIPSTVTYANKTYPVTTIGDHAFFQCSLLTSISIPNSITTISYDAFSDCTGLTRVTITDLAAWCNTSIYLWSNPLIYAHHLYLNDTEVTDLTIPDGIPTIRDYAFQGCSGLTSVTVPNSVTSIGDNAFEGCTGLTSATIGNSVTEIGSVAFEGCTSLTSVSLGKSVSTINGSAFSGCTALTSIELPTSVSFLGSKVFYGCSGLKSILIPDAVTEIGGMAFYGCTGLTSVTIGKSVTTMGYHIFSDASAIETITCKATTPPSWSSGMDMFTINVYNHAPLHVPTGTERAYMSSSNWGQFLTIIGDVSDDNPPYDPDYMRCDVNGDGEVTIADINVIINMILTHQ